MISLTYNTVFVLFIFFYTIFACSALTSCGPFNGFTSTFFLCDGDTITSAGEIKFRLGFFTPKGNIKKNRYVGIWYVSNPEIVVWVANRDSPLPENSKGSFGVLNDGDGKLQLLDEKNHSYFFTEFEPSNSRMARLLEGGNLVLSDKTSGKVLWQSFDHPTDTFLPGMKMSENLKLISWMSNEDPSTGNYSFKQGKGGVAVSGYVIMKGTSEYWKTGGQSSYFTTNNKMNELANYLLEKNYNPVKPSKSNYTVSLRNYTVSQPDFNTTRLLMSWWGEIQYFRLNTSNTSWVKIWSEPQTKCSVYNACGKFGTCRLSDRGVLCDCLPGFKSEVPESWDSGDYSGGCIRKSSLCGETNYTFSLQKVIKVKDADFPYEAAKNEKKCKEGCLEDCQCQAYSYRYGSGRDVRGSKSSAFVCYIWQSDLADIQIGNGTDENGTDELNIFVKVANITLGASAQNQPQGTHPQNKSLSQKVVIILITCSVIAVLLLTCSLYYIYYRRKKAKRKESRTGIKGNTGSGSHPRQFSEEDKESIDVPFFDLQSILAATDSFSDANKLGEGGFGPVYKATFPGGQEIAVKRLSIHSMQGLDELKNEVVLIAKLQHRNLVRLLGYCIEGDENILLYEYMPNKSLDAFIFDQTLCVLLNWEKRFEIILGIARGLLYLHQDSRLRVIHRDLKASNILLDEDMNPKISDFGLARIVRGRETEANTNRVVGTYGYMSPEYALEGLFSIKSDVFSFGVLVLEIISGKKNTGFYKSHQDLNLLGYAWRLLKEDNPLGIMDQKIVESCNKNELLKCIIIGLLCVQEDPNDRPNTSNIVAMLGSSDIENLPSPKQPAFVARTIQQTMSTNESRLSEQQIQSNNEITLSVVKPR